MSDHLTWDFNRLTTKEKQRKLSLKDRVAKLESSVRELKLENEKLHTKLIHQTRVRGGRWFRLSMGKELYADEAIRLIMEHLGMTFQYHNEHYTVNPKPEPVEEEEYDDEA